MMKYTQPPVGRRFDGHDHNGHEIIVNQRVRRRGRTRDPYKPQDGNWLIVYEPEPLGMQGNSITWEDVEAGLIRGAFLCGTVFQPQDDQGKYKAGKYYRVHSYGNAGRTKLRKTTWID